MKTAEDLFQKLGKSKYFSKIDLSKGYWQISVKKTDIAKTAFVTPDGRYKFRRMPFGMKNSGEILVRGMRKILKDMDNVESYIDDLLIFTDSWEAHVKTVEELQSKLQRVNLTAKPSKCVFGTKSVEFLGHDVRFDWIITLKKLFDSNALSRTLRHWLQLINSGEFSARIKGIYQVEQKLEIPLCRICSSRSEKEQPARDFLQNARETTIGIF